MQTTTNSVPSNVRVFPAKSAKFNSVVRALDDLVAGWKCRELWMFLGLRDVGKHYQRSVLGPLWVTLNMALLIAGLGVLYAHIFQLPVREYLPFMALGFILWGLIGGLITDGCTVFSKAAVTIKQVSLPLSFHVFQFAWKHLITFLHNFTIYIVLVLAFAIWPTVNVLLFIPALLLILLNGIFVALILGTLSTRFRDIPPIVASFTQVCFFMTPILWQPGSLKDRAVFLDANPFYHFLQITREPLLGRTGTAENWLVAVTLTLALGVVAIYFFGRYRSRIAYWV